MVDPLIDRTTRATNLAAARISAVFRKRPRRQLLAKYCYSGLSGCGTRYNKVTRRLHLGPQFWDSGPKSKRRGSRIDATALPARGGAVWSGPSSRKTQKIFSQKTKDFFVLSL